jgi:hypothetical protein
LTRAFSSLYIIEKGERGPSETSTVSNINPIFHYPHSLCSSSPYPFSIPTCSKTLDSHCRKSKGHKTVTANYYPSLVLASCFLLVSFPYPHLNSLYLSVHAPSLSPRHNKPPVSSARRKRKTGAFSLNPVRDDKPQSSNKHPPPIRRSIFFSPLSRLDYAFLLQDGRLRFRNDI